MRMDHLVNTRHGTVEFGHDGGNDHCVLRLIDITDPFPKFGDRVGREYQSFTSGLAKVSASRAVRRILVVHMGVKLPG